MAEASENRNDLSGTIAGHAVQANAIYGGVHLHQGPSLAVRTPPVDAYGGYPLEDLTDPFALEVHRAIEYTPAMGSDPLPVLPRYISRTHDVRLNEVITTATEGRSAIAVLVGGSSTGKTRACWEAVHSLPAGWRLWHPLDATGLIAGLRAGAPAPRTVIWLNETQVYLQTADNDQGESAAAALRAILRDPSRAPILVLCTLWPEYWGQLTLRAEPNSRDIYQQSRALLTGHDIRVPDVFSTADLAALKAAAADDPRLAQTLQRAEQGQITQYLAGGPALLERYNNAPPVARALLDVAIDARRLGHGPVLSHHLLEAAAPAYLTDAQWEQAPQDWLEQALSYGGKPARGPHGALAQIRPRPGEPHPAEPGYRLADFLEQHGRRERRTAVPPRGFWDAITQHAAHEDLPRLAASAEHRGLLRIATRLYSASAAAGDSVSLIMSAQILYQHDRKREAQLLQQRAADLGDAIGLFYRGGERCQHGQFEDALDDFATAARRGFVFALWAPVSSFQQAGRFDDVLTWLKDCADSGIPTAAGTAAHWLREAGRHREALVYARRGTDTGDELAARTMGDLLRDTDQIDEALVCYLRAVELDAGTTGASEALGAGVSMLEEARGLQAALTWLDECARTGITEAHFLLVFHLLETGRLDQALDQANRAADAGEMAALTLAAEALEDADRLGEALHCYRRAAATGNSHALKHAARLTRRLHGLDETLSWLNAQAAAGNAGALLAAASILHKQDHNDEALSYIRRAANSGESEALSRAVAILCAAERTDEAIQLDHYGWEPDGSIAEPWTSSGPPVSGTTP